MMSSNAISVIGKLFFEPKAAFESLKENSKPWLPLALIMVSTLALFYWYYATVDFSWLIDHTLSAKPDMKAEEREMVTKMLTKDRMMITTLVGALIGMPVVFALYGLYFMLASKVMGSAISYGKWFGFAVWVSVPTLIGAPLMALQIATGHGQVSLEGLNMLSLNFLIANLPADHAWAGLMNNLSLTTFWTMFLTFVGFRVWTGRSVASCALATALPYVVIYGVWVAKLMFFK
ncbi:Yip1 family protein [Undibacterium sp. Ji22W]|uniref:Yip1 family protein n=1 Tax=Undibacterium sp. Ji22W TaxID=3413038 RepID=UPI003BF08515